jgi:hypothetical protein
MKNEIINKAIDVLTNDFGITANYKETTHMDGELELLWNDLQLQFTIEIKKELRQFQLLKLPELHHKYPNLLLVVDRLFPAIKEGLRKLGIPYIETNGNVFIKTKELFLFIDTNKTRKEDKTGGNRAFTKTGLKVLFHFLEDKSLINQPHRTIALKAGVALGNVPQIIDGLYKKGIIIRLGKKTYVWEIRATLLQQWIEAYETTLRPTLKKGRYALRTKWDEVNINTDKTVWGGEPAADLLTNHLRPEKYILYTNETRNELIKNYKLIPDKTGTIEVFEIFWNQQDNKKKNAPPLVVYADLLIEGGKRNEETAQIIFDEYIKPNL